MASELADFSGVAHSTPQLPVSWYFDRAVYDIEQRVLFEQGPGYVGHELMVPNAGDYHALEWMGNARALVHNDHGIELLGNVCRHRQAVILKGRGNAKKIVCPVHRWAYSGDGTLLAAPRFPANPCRNLGRTALTRWNGLLFAGGRDVAKDLAGLGVLQDLDFSGYVFEHAMIDEYAFNWKAFIEVYLEDYHVAPFHPGLSHFVTCDDIKWEYGDWYSAQTVGINHRLARPGTPVYARWHEQVLRACRGEVPPHGAIWLVYYPNVMIEWYPHVLVVSTVLPRGAEHCTNVVEFYYPEDIARSGRDFIEAEQAAYKETAVEDDQICTLMQQGRRALHAQGISDAGPYQSPLEDGMRHFHAFLRREIEPHLGT